MGALFIKVCGMRQPANIQAVANLGVHALGFIFYPKSPRYCLPSLELDSLANLPDDMQKVGVFVNTDIDIVQMVANDFGLTTIQLHGEESPAYARKLVRKGLEVWKAFGINNAFDFKATLPFQEICAAFVFDTKTEAHGGSGQKYNWEKLKEYEGKTPFLLSGGIKPTDTKAIHQFAHPAFWGLDLNSGFEIEPGLKDPQAIKQFLDQLGA
jgi:phosphoribosylanthranilate isomerase